MRNNGYWCGPVRLVQQESNSDHAIALLTLVIGKPETLVRGLEPAHEDAPEEGGIFPG